MSSFYLKMRPMEPTELLDALINIFCDAAEPFRPTQLAISTTLLDRHVDMSDLKDADLRSTECLTALRSFLSEHKYVGLRNARAGLLNGGVLTLDGLDDVFPALRIEVCEELTFPEGMAAPLAFLDICDRYFDLSPARSSGSDERLANLRHTEERRHLLHKLEVLTEAPSRAVVSKLTEHNRGVVDVICISMLVTSGLAAIACAYLFFHSTRPEWPDLGPFVACTALFAAVLMYYLRWNENSSQSLARSETDAWRLKGDILRAGWLAEFILEARDSSEVGLPEDLIERLAGNMFTEPLSTKQRR